MNNKQFEAKYPIYCTVFLVSNHNLNSKATAKSTSLNHFCTEKQIIKKTLLHLMFKNGKDIS